MDDDFAKLFKFVVFSKFFSQKFKYSVEKASHQPRIPIFFLQIKHP